MGIPTKFGNPDDYNCTGFKYHTTALVTAHIDIQINGDFFFNFGIPDDYPELNSTIGISSS